MFNFANATAVARSALCALGLAGALCAAPALAQDYTIDTLAGNGTDGSSGDGGPAVAASIGYVYDTTADAAGNVFFADYSGQRVRRIDAATGIITTVAGTGTAGFSGDGGPATAAQLWGPLSVAINSAGDLFIVDRDNRRIRRVDGTTGIITTIAGNGSYAGATGDGGPATNAGFSDVRGIALDSTGNIYVSEFYLSVIRMIDTAGTISQVATVPSEPWNLAVDSADNLYIAAGRDPSSSDYSGRILRMDHATGAVTTVAGGGTDPGENVPASSATLSRPYGVAVDELGNIYIAELNSARIRMVSTATGLVRTIGGTGTAGYSGDGGPADSAMMNTPVGLSVDADGHVFVAELGNRRIRVLDPGTTASADLVLDAAAVAPSVSAGSFLQYTVHLRNDGPDDAAFPGAGFAFDAELADLLVDPPTGWTCDVPTVGGGVTITSCTASALVPSDTYQFALSATAPSSRVNGSVMMAASATSTTDDPDTGNNNASASIAVDGSADLRVQVLGPLRAPTGGKAGQYRAIVRDIGPDAALAPVLMLHGNVPASAVTLDAPAGWICALVDAGDGFDANCGGPGLFASGLPTVSAWIVGAGVVQVDAAITSATPDPDASNNTDSYSTRAARR